MLWSEVRCGVVVSWWCVGCGAWSVVDRVAGSEVSGGNRVASGGDGMVGGGSVYQESINLRCGVVWVLSGMRYCWCEVGCGGLLA